MKCNIHVVNREVARIAALLRRNAAQSVRLAAALGVLFTLSLSGSARPVAAAMNRGDFIDSHITYHPDRPGRPRPARQGAASKEAHKASEYAAIRQKLGHPGATGSVTRPFFGALR